VLADINSFIWINLIIFYKIREHIFISIRGGMMTEESDPEKRLNLSFVISLPEQKGKTINVSATGIYFEVITNGIDAFDHSGQ
jgi:hypothetical protein